MSDLSRLLDDVYGDTAPAVAPQSDPSQAPLAGLPDWAIDSVLDEAFADWVPGPPVAPVPDPASGGTVALPIAERSSASPSVPRSAFTALAECPAPAPEAPRAWCREDDDILPTGRRSGRSRGSRAKEPVQLEPAEPIDQVVAPEEAGPAEPGVSRFRRRRG